jgi:Glycosyltransferase family 87
MSVRRMVGAAPRVVLIVAVIGAGLLFARGLTTIPGHEQLFDFKGGLYNAGVAILHGRDPYQPGFLAQQAAIIKAGGIALGETSQNAFSIPVYPAPANLAMVPLSLLPFWLAGGLFTLLSIAAMVLGLRLLGVRDWRCVALTLVSWPFLFGLDVGALGPLLMLGVAAAWRWRERVWPPAIAIASIVVAKVFPWALGVWLLITRRFKTLAIAAVIGVVACLAAWAVVGFEGMAQYPRMLSNLSLIEEGRAVSLVAVLLAAGVPLGVAKGAALAATAALLGGAWRLSRRGSDAQSYGLIVIAALTSSPIVWEHYMVLLFVPIALVSPELSMWWLLPLCTPLFVVLSALVVPFTASANGLNHDTVRAAIAWLAVEGILVWRLLGLKPRPALAVRPTRDATKLRVAGEIGE